MIMSFTVSDTKATLQNRLCLEESDSKLCSSEFTPSVYLFVLHF